MYNMRRVADVADKASETRSVIGKTIAVIDRDFFQKSNIRR
jgi:hypothetical protein